MLVIVGHEQAQNPGEKSLGVAVLGMIFLPPVAILAVGSAVCLIGSAATFVSDHVRKSSGR